MKHPERLGKYRIIDVLGEGAMGVVYRARDPDIRRTVALKTIHGHLLRDDGGGDDDTVRRFATEAQAAGRLSHPGIVAVHEFGADQGLRYIAMEYVRGDSLARLLAAGRRFGDAEIVSIATQLLDAIGHAHRHGVWHRDIKAANVILTPEGRVKVADFGIARVDGTGATQVTLLAGTPAYMAPEQLLGRPLDHRVDLYAAGVLLYLLLTGRLPFGGPIESLMHQVVNQPPAAPSGVAGAGRPASFDAVVLTALAKDPHHRHASAAAFADALRRATDGAFDDDDRTVVRPAARGAAAPPSAGAPGAAAPDPATAESFDGTTANAATTSGGTTATFATSGGTAQTAATTVGGTTATSTAAAGWDAAMLARAEAALVRQLGPIAGVVVRRAARDGGDPQALVARLAAQVPDDDARAAFVAAMSAPATLPPTSLPPPLPPSPPPPRPPPSPTAGGDRAAAVAAPGRPGDPGGDGDAVDAAFVAQATRLLAMQLGPLAATVSRRAAASHPARHAFVRAIAESLPDADGRQALLDALARLR